MSKKLKISTFKIHSQMMLLSKLNVFIRDGKMMKNKNKKERWELHLRARIQSNKELELLN